MKFLLRKTLNLSALSHTSISLSVGLNFEKGIAVVTLHEQNQVIKLNFYKNDVIFQSLWMTSFWM
jgi:hypothetical protein